MIKAQITGRIISSGISDVAITSVYSEKTCLKKLIIITIIIINRKKPVFGGRQKFTSAIKQRPE